MLGLTVTSASSAWSYGGSILTFLFPMLLFIVVVGALYVVYTKPHVAPGHNYPPDRRAAVSTAEPRRSAPEDAAGSRGTAAEGGPKPGQGDRGAGQGGTAE